MGKLVKGQVGSPVTSILCLMKVGEDEMDQITSMRTQTSNRKAFDVR